MKQNRLRSKVVWAAVLAQVLILVSMYIPQISEQVKITGSVVLEILTIFGILNDPTSKNNF